MDDIPDTVRSAGDAGRFVTVFATARLVPFAMAEEALKQAGIPYQRQEETAAGLKLAMSVLSSQEPGVFWSLLVPESLLADARAVLSELPFPITTDPGPWDAFPTAGGPRQRARDARMARRLILGGLVASLVLAFVLVLRAEDRLTALGLLALVVVVNAAVPLWVWWDANRWLRAKRHLKASPGIPDSPRMLAGRPDGHEGRSDPS